MTTSGVPSDQAGVLTPAAQYIRMSTEHQQYSTENQADVIRDYAARRGYQIVATYTDARKSGLRIEGRDSLRRLIDDVQAGRAAFKTILAYDVSRVGIREAQLAAWLNERGVAHTELLGRHATLSSEIIDGAEGMPGTAAYQARFGSLVAAYGLVGFVPGRDYGYVEVNRHIRAIRSPFVENVLRQFEAGGGQVTRSPDGEHFLINGEFSAAVVFTRCAKTSAGRSHWLVRGACESPPDITLVVRMDGVNQGPLDYYLLPRIDLGVPDVQLGEANWLGLELHRHADLDAFVRLGARARIEVAA